ncbi:hypothetical protein BRC81_01860 [Halobacteriales archaeon QS_1_68_20]|nr:MAG: hypothetical protein BRC81_01860 [Halobacteriales archaeon QS_1_68_20]
MSYRREPTTDEGEPDSKRQIERQAFADGSSVYDGRRVSVDVTDEGVAVTELAAGTYDWEFRSELRRACRATSEVEPNAIVVTGEPEAFAITEDDADGDDDGYGAEQELQATCDACATLGVPVIGAPRGNVRGYGMALALCTDLRIGGASSEYCCGGVPPRRLRATGVTKRLVATVGRDRTREFVHSDRTFDAETMADWGLLNYVVDDDAVLDRALALATEFAGRPTDAFEHMKHAVRAATSVSDPDVDLGAGSGRSLAACVDDRT